MRRGLVDPGPLNTCGCAFVAVSCTGLSGRACTGVSAQNTAVTLAEKTLGSSALVPSALTVSLDLLACGRSQTPPFAETG